MKKIITLMMMAVMAAPVMAQEVNPSDITEQSVTGLRHYKFGDNWFIQGFWGGNFSMSENSRHLGFTKNMNPSYGLAVGKWLSPSIGLRVKLDHMIQTSMANEEAVAAYPEIYGNGKYKYKLWTGTVDALLNLNNIVGAFRETTKFNVNMIMGLGYLRSFGFDNKVKEWKDKTGKNPEFAPYEINKHPKSYLVGKVGLAGDLKLSEALDLGLELTANVTNDKFNGKQDDQLYDVFLNAQLGLTYHFKDHFGDRRFKNRSLNDADILNSLNDRINAARQDLANARPRTENRVENTYKQIEVLDMTVNFIIDKYNITDLQKKNIAAVAKYLQDNPGTNLIVTGYADVKTAYPAYNLKLSERRAKAVYNCLVKEFGVNPDRLKIDYKGDTVQPYDRKNEWNRVVVFVIEK